MNDSTISQLQTDVKRMKDKMANLELKVENLTHSNNKLQEIVSELTERLDSFMDEIKEKDRIIKEKENDISYERSRAFLNEMMNDDIID